MERFFTEHHVLRDRDPDELHRVASDSEASEDEDPEEQVHTHSVHDPTGPWKQAAVDGPWGAPQKKKPGTANRFFKSAHTGPKGVINDYKAHKRHQREEHERKERERMATLMRIAKGASTADSSAQAVGCDATAGSDCECDDMLLDDDFLQQYNAMRVHQLHEQAKKRNVYGSLEYITPSQFVELTDNAPANVTMFVHLYHPENYACGLLNQHLEQIAAELKYIKFAALVAHEADESITMADLPVVLIYRGSALQDTVVKVSKQLDGEFSMDRIKKFVLHHAAEAA